MKATELRVGNLIYLQQLNEDLTEIIDMPCKVTALLIRDCYHLGDDWTGKPIPLTEQWLKRFGPISWLSHDIGGYFFWFNGEKKYILFLHTLQNVYFAIETIELQWLDTKIQNT